MRFTAGEWSSPNVSGERPPPILGFSYIKISKYEAIMFGGYAMGVPNTDSRLGRMNDLYIMDFTNTAHVHCTRVIKPENVPWPIVRSHHSTCVLASPLTGHWKKTHILTDVTVGGEGNGWDSTEKRSGKTLDDVWIGEFNQRKTIWKQVHIPEDRLVRIKRQRHSATVCKVSDFKVIVVVQGGVEAMVRDERIAQQMDMLADTSILEFELHHIGGDEVWVLTRAHDLNYYKKVMSQRNRGLVGRSTSVTSPSCLLNMRVLLYCKKGDQTIRIIDELAPEWINIGHLLNFATCDLDSISQQCKGCPKSCCEQMLNKWLAGRNDERDTRPKNWDTLLEVIKAARWGTLASKIKEVVFED